MRGPSVVVIGLLVLATIPIALAASPDGIASGWKEVLNITSASSGTQKMFEAFDTASLNLYDFDGDGDLEIVSNNDNNHAYVIDSRTGKVLAEIVTPRPGGDKWPVRELNPIAVGDLYGDNVPCLVIPTSDSNMYAYCLNWSNSTAERWSFDQKWRVKVDAELYEPDFHEAHPWIEGDDNTANDHPGLDGNAYLADVDGDGTKEVFVETDGYPGQFAFGHDGTYLWSRSYWDGNGGAKVLDIDKDGKKEAVFVSDSGAIAAYDAKTGAIKWVFEAAKNGAYPGSVPVPPLIADLHGDGQYETVFGARNVSRDQSDPNWINESHARYFALDSKGRLLWSVSYEWMNPLQYNHPAAADVNEDGVLDVVFLDWNTVGHNPGDWDTTDRKSNLFVLDGRDGSVIWRTGVPIYWSNKDFVIADVDGDGSHEVIVPNPKSGSEGLGVYDLKDGAYEGWFPLSWSMSRGPVAGNLYGDGKLYLVVPVNKKLTDQPNYRKLDVGLREGQLRILDTGAKYDVLFSANFHNNEDQKEEQVQGTIGTPPTPATPPPVTPTPPANATPSPTTPTPTGTPLPTEPTPPSPSPTPTSATPPADPGVSKTTRGVPLPGLGALVAAIAVGALAFRRRRG